MRLIAFYHLYASGQWEEPAHEYFDLLASSGLREELGVINLGVIGPPERRRVALAFCESQMDIQLVAQADAGWEQLTLNLLWDHRDAADAFCYFHTKGSAVQSEWNDIWRRSMAIGIIGHWRECAEALENGMDLVGSHWLTPEKFPGDDVYVPYFGGNGWWARADYIKTLPPPDMENRHRAEVWIGQNNPKVLDLAPGWPGVGTILTADGKQETAWITDGTWGDRADWDHGSG